MDQLPTIRQNKTEQSNPRITSGLPTTRKRRQGHLSVLIRTDEPISYVTEYLMEAADRALYQMKRSGDGAVTAFELVRPLQGTIGIANS